jgi:hypothetical protein
MGLRERAKEEGVFMTTVIGGSTANVEAVEKSRLLRIRNSYKQ